MLRKKTWKKTIRNFIIMGCVMGMVCQPVSVLAAEEGDSSQSYIDDSESESQETLNTEDIETDSDLETESETSEESTTDETDIDGTESGSSVELEEESESESSAAPESESNEESNTDTDTAQEERVENSWRFENGVWLGIYGTDLFTSSDFIPWTKTENGYINSVGDIIPGVIARGIDVSQWQGDIDWEKVAADDVSFAIIRCGSSRTYDDWTWEYNSSECERLGIPYGSYFYSYADSPEEAKIEAEHALRLLEGHNLTYPVYYDLEDDYVRYETLSDGTRRQRTGAELAEIAKVFCDTLEAAGYDVSIYANTDWWTNVLKDPYFESFDDRWVAQYNVECTYNGPYMMWQCSSTGKIDGINTNVDINMLFSEPAGQPQQPEEPVDDHVEEVQQFVTRLYSLILGREPDDEGMNTWTNVLINKESTGAKVVKDFLDSTEFWFQHTTDEEYVEILYNTCLDRSSDVSGKNTWVTVLSEGFSRDYVLKGFIESTEFNLICLEYGIDRGEIILVEDRDKNDDVTRYVSRCYNYFLGRTPDAEGLNNWTRMILADRNTAKEMPHNFMFSEEFLNKNVSDEEFVTICYRAILDREPDSKGLADWMDALASGKSRNEVCDGFTESIEFMNLLNRYGL